MIKKLVIVPLLVAVGALVLAACGGAEDKTAQQTTAPAVAPAATDDDAAAAEPAAATAPAAPAATAAPVATAVPVITIEEEEVFAELKDVRSPTEFVMDAAMALNIPISYVPEVPYAPIYGGHLDLEGYGWTVYPNWDMPTVNTWSTMTVSFYAENLLTFPQGPGTNPADYTIMPQLAESWEMSDDGLTYTFNLRQGVKWGVDPEGLHEWVADDIDAASDVTAHDWVKTLALSFGIETSAFKPKYPEISGPEAWSAIDDYTLQVDLSMPAAPFLFKIALRGPQLYNTIPFDKRMADEGIEIQEAMNHIKVQMGTGPWIVTDYVPDTSVAYQRNPNYWLSDDQGNQLPFIDSIEWFAMADERLQDAGFRTGKLGALALETCGMSTQRYEDLNASNPDTYWEVFVDPSNQRGLFFNYGEDGAGEGKPWNDIRVRQAIQLSIDKLAWVEGVLGGWGLPYPTVLGAGNQWWLTPGNYGDTMGDGVASEDLFEYDLDKAKAMLAAAGYPEGIQDMTFMSSHNNGARWFSESEIMVESLRNLGIDVTMTVKDGPARSATQRTGEYDLMYWWPGYGFEPSDWFGYSVHSEITRYDQPVSGLIDPVLDEMVVDMNSEMDPVVRYGLVADLQRYLTERQYVVYSTNWIQIVAIAPWLKNYQYHYDFTTSPSMRHAWIDRSGM